MLFERGKLGLIIPFSRVWLWVGRQGPDLRSSATLTDRHHRRRPLEGIQILQARGDRGDRRVVAQDQIERPRRRRQPVGFLVWTWVIVLQVHRERSVRVL